MSEEVKIYTGGAARSTGVLPFGDIPAEALELMAEAWAEGRGKYEQKLYPWEKNWKRGGKTFAMHVIDHAQGHLTGTNELIRDRMLQLQAGRNPDTLVNTYNGDTLRQHISHLLANAAMLAWFYVNGTFDSMDGAEFNDGTKPGEAEEPLPEEFFDIDTNSEPDVPEQGTLDKIAAFFRRQ